MDHPRLDPDSTITIQRTNGPGQVVLPGDYIRDHLELNDATACLTELGVGGLLVLGPEPRWRAPALSARRRWRG